MMSRILAMWFRQQSSLIFLKTMRGMGNTLVSEILEILILEYSGHTHPYVNTHGIFTYISGFPSLGVLLQKLENPALQACLNVPSNQVFLLFFFTNWTRSIEWFVENIFFVRSSLHITLYCLLWTQKRRSVEVAFLTFLLLYLESLILLYISPVISITSSRLCQLRVWWLINISYSESSVIILN